MENKDYRKMLIGRAYKFSLDIIKLIGSFSQNDFTLRIIVQQLIRSATSIGANIIEAQASSSKKDFMNFISYALKSANETKYWLALLRDSKKLTGTAIDTLYKEVDELSKLLGSSMMALKGRKQL